MCVSGEGSRPRGNGRGPPSFSRLVDDSDAERVGAEAQVGEDAGLLAHRLSEDGVFDEHVEGARLGSRELDAGCWSARASQESVHGFWVEWKERASGDTRASPSFERSERVRQLQERAARESAGEMMRGGGAARGRAQSSGFALTRSRVNCDCAYLPGSARLGHDRSSSARRSRRRQGDAP